VIEETRQSFSPPRKAHYHHAPLKILHCALAASALSMCVCACAVAPAPTAPSAIVTLDALAADGGVESSFSRAFLQNAYEAPDHIEPIKILRGPLRVYLRTQDEAGRAIDAGSLDLTQRVLNESAWIWSGETFGITEIIRGTGTREKVPGWLTVKWSGTASPDRCGRSTVGVDGGSIEFNTSGSCSCGLSTVIYPRLIRHELGHAMGYYHTDGPGDVMYGRTITSDACDLLPSDRERRQAKLIHSQAVR
jgi:hypothetical protein